MAIHLSVLFFGLAGVFGKLIILSPPLIVLGRVLFASLALLVIARMKGLSLKLRAANHYLLLPVLGVVLAIHWIAFFKSIQVSTVAVGVLSYSTFPVFAILLEPFLAREKIAIFDVIAAIVAFLGAALVIPEFRIENEITQGVAWGLVSGFTFALLSVLNRGFVRAYPATVIALYEDSAATLLLLPLFFVTEFDIQVRDLAYLLVLGILCTAVAHSLFISGLKRIKAGTASVIAMLEPVYGIAFAIVLLGELPETRTVLGGVVILGAVLFATSRSDEPPQSIV